MDILQIINEINLICPDIDKNRKATQQLIADTESYIGKPLPLSYKKFVKYFSNGIFLLDAEPVCGVGRIHKATPCGVIGPSSLLIDASTKSNQCKIINEGSIKPVFHCLHNTFDERATLLDKW